MVAAWWLHAVACAERDVEVFVDFVVGHGGGNVVCDDCGGVVIENWSSSEPRKSEVVVD